jgi:hypothetical protein
MERIIAKNFNNFKGRDVRSSDLVRDINSSIEFENARIVDEDSCVSREGFHIRGKNSQNKGLYSYVYSDLDTGETLQELISLSDSVYKKVDTTFTITYSGTHTTQTFSHRLNTSTGEYEIILFTKDGLGNEYTNTITSGTGLEAVPGTLADLKVLIELNPDFVVTISGDTTLPAPFLPILVDQTFDSNVYTVTAYNWEEVATLASVTLTDYNTAYAQSYFELASVANVSNCLFIATGYNPLLKYDGQNVYRAGLPIPSAAATTSLGGTGITDTNIKYIYLYKQVDNRGNEIFGVDSDPSAAVSPANQTVTLTLQNVLAASGFNTGCAIVNGLQAGVNTITVDAAHTFKIGDTAYFYNGVSASYVEREITGTAATTITVAGAAVNVADNAVISNNLRIVIYRTTNSGNLYYKVAEIPNNSLAATQTYADALAIASLGTQYFPPTKDRDALEIYPKYLTVHQGLLIASGDPSEPNTWFYSSEESPEYFPAISNFEDVKNTSTGGIRGLGSDQEYLIIGTERSLFVFSGDLAAGSGRLEKINQGNIGFASHNSIVDIGIGIIFLSKTGFYLLQNGYNVLEVGEPINTDFTNLDGRSRTQLPLVKKAVAAYFDETKEYICFIPSETGSGANKYANDSSLTYIFTTDRIAWGLWTKLNMAGGITIYNDNIFFQSSTQDISLNVTGNLWERNTGGVIDDYADHNQPIEFKLGTQWMEDGEPSVFKTWLWIKVYNLLRTLLAASFGLTVALERDYKKGITWANFTLDFGSGTSSIGYALFPWGLSAWGTPSVDARKKKLKSGKAQSLRYVFSNSTLNQKVSISAWETIYTPNYKRELKN